MERQILQNACNVIHMNKLIIRTYTRMFVRTILYSWKQLHKRSERTQECSPERLLERFWKRLHKRLECTQERKNVLVHSDN